MATVLVCIRPMAFGNFIFDKGYMSVPITGNRNYLEFNIYPIPAKENMSVVCDLQDFENGVIQITDITGRLMFLQAINTKIPITGINISFLAAGIYSVGVEADQQFISERKIVVAHYSYLIVNLHYKQSIFSFYISTRV